MLPQLRAEGPSADIPKNRTAGAQRAADFTIDQAWSSYTPEEHDRWDRLLARQSEILPGRACDSFLEAVAKLKLSEAGIPEFERLSDRLQDLTGWRVVPVAELVPDEIFFDHLANRRFPAGAFIRPEAELDYLKEPDVFHDVFGHVPLLADPVFADFMQAYGQGGQRALARGQLPNLARLYWYSVEFGLIQTAEGLRIFGAGILSSPAESVFSLDSASPNRIGFDLERVMRTNYIIDDFQQSYFVIESFQQLLDDCYVDFAGLYDRLGSQTDLEADALVPGDRIITTGDRSYFDRSPVANEFMSKGGRDVHG
ncbi:phenylalanine 4-monooxygenase [Pelagibius sp. Alg239-R121]|uniref:phenylalanine 4-monooxygenase n=1 Tax=Pelagibius sp. Alg239-R121 TaxID=2993448 RepID=UPI0024A74FF2|nr:phenylalanine 4-monooxygenase [Pelagibius sp. Alg239-R121]